MGYLAFGLLILTPVSATYLRTPKAHKSGIAYLTHESNEHQERQVRKLQNAFGKRFFLVAPEELEFKTNVTNRVSMTPNSEYPADEKLQKLSLNGQGGILLGRGVLELLRHPELEYMWVMENDVFFKDADPVAELMRYWEDRKADYIPVNMWNQHEQPFWKHWDLLEGHVPKGSKKFGSFGPVMRVSRKFVNQLQRHAKDHGSLTFFETLFPTLAKHNNMIIRTNLKEHIANVHSPNPKRVGHKGCWSSEQIFKALKSHEARLFHPAKWSNGKFQKCDSPTVHKGASFIQGVENLNL